MNSRWLSDFATMVVVLGAGPLLAQAPTKPEREIVSFGTLRAPTVETARSQALEWLKNSGKADNVTLKALAAIWDQSESVLMDKVAETLALGNAQARELLSKARDPNAPAPVVVPELLKDAKHSVYFRANLGLAYAKALSDRRIYEEALETLRLFKPEQVVDPASYLFHRAVAEHAMIHKTEAMQSIARLLDDVTDAPERYKTVASLMIFDMLSWRDKDLGDIARKMSNIERRLELVRGGAKTQKIEKEVIARLDELIKKMENQQKNEQNSSSCPNDGQCPSGGQQQPGGQPSNNTQASNPQQDSMGGQGTGPGHVDPKRLKEVAENWGKLPEKERARAMLELTRDLPPKYREVIENYFKKLQTQDMDSTRP